MKTKSILILIIFIAAIIRMPTFFLPKNNGDQIQYIALASKINQKGLSEYNIYDIQCNLDKTKTYIIFYPLSNGNLINYYKGYWREPLHHRPFLFPLLISFSHNIFSKGKTFKAINTNLKKDFLKIPKNCVKEQFYCAIIPFLSSILFIYTTFLLGKTMFSEKNALLSSFIIAITPIDIFCAQKILADSLFAFLSTASVLLLILYIKSKKAIHLFLSGIFAGLSYLTRQNGLILMLISITVFIVASSHEIIGKKQALKAFLIHFLVSGLISSIWFAKLYAHYKTLLYIPLKNHYQEIKNDKWFKILSKRPFYMYIINPLVQMPLYIFSFLNFRYFKNLPIERKFNILILTSWSLILIAPLFFFSIGKELRYILPALAPLSILSAEGIIYFYNELCKKNRTAGKIIMLFTFLFSLIWGASIGLNVVLTNLLFIWIPF